MGILSVMGSDSWPLGFAIAPHGEAALRLHRPP